MIISSPRDERVAAWLSTVATSEQIAGAVAALSARAWPAKVAARLGLVIPAAVYDPAAAEASAEVKRVALARLAALRNELKGGSA